jgi:hyperosmotically inducible protein
MKKHLFSVLALVTAAGCAHGQADGRHSAAAHDGQRTASRDTEKNEPSAVANEQDGDRVALPDNRARRGQMANAGEDLPGGGDKDRPASADSFGAEPDNTRVNERDREASALTPMDQSESDADRDLLQRIRKAVIADDSLSFTAKNVKIITRDGRVTLRGSVNNAREKATLEKTALDAAGPKHVSNELEVSN